MSRAGVPATVYVELSGKGKWVSVKQIDDYGKRGCVLYPNQESLDLFKKMKAGWKEGVEGIRNDAKVDEDGEFIRLSRKDVHETRFRTIALGPPKMVDANGAPFDGLVGNGSDLTCNCELYFFMKPNKTIGSALRLQSIRVDNLVEYIPKRDMPEDEQKMLPKSPVPQW